MINPELYKKNNDLQKGEAIMMLKNHGHRINWQKNASVIDLGSGDGSVTVNVVMKQLPSDFQRLVGVDISKEMVHHSNGVYGNDKIYFSVMDIGGVLPFQFRGSFHHAVSFCAIQWVHNQETVFKNIYDMLKESGDCLLLIVCSSPVYSTWRMMANMHKWMKSKSVFDRVIPRYHDLQEPDKEVRRLMTGLGFKDVDVKLHESTFVYRDVSHFKGFAQSLNPLNLYGAALKEFADDFVDIALKLNFVDRDSENVEAINLTHSTMIVYGRK